MIRKLIDKLFLSKEVIIGGVPQFRRYTLLKTPWFGIHIHKIYKSDIDDHPHNHPWNFLSVILYGSYQEMDKNNMLGSMRTMGDFYILKTEDYHKIYHGDPATVLVFSGKRTNDNWGYWTRNGFVDWKRYRAIHPTKEERGAT